MNSDQQPLRRPQWLRKYPNERAAMEDIWGTDYVRKYMGEVHYQEGEQLNLFDAPQEPETSETL